MNFLGRSGYASALGYFVRRERRNTHDLDTTLIHVDFAPSLEPKGTNHSHQVRDPGTTHTPGLQTTSGGGIVVVPERASSCAMSVPCCRVLHSRFEPDETHGFL